MNRRILWTCGLAVLALGLVAWAQDLGVFGASPVLANQATVLVKGEASLSDGSAAVALPSWFESTVQPTGRVVSVTCKGGFSPLWVSDVADGRFTVKTNEEGSPTQAFQWLVIADRK